MPSDRERLLDILEAAERIASYTEEGRERFERDELVQVWVVHHLEILGEAARGISEELRARHPEVHWKAAVGMRDVLVHHYFGVDVDVVWATVTRDLPILVEHVRAILEDLQE